MRDMSRFELRTITADDVGAPDSPWRDCEVWDGIPVVREPSMGWAESVAGRIFYRLAQFVWPRDLGSLVTSSAGFLLARKPDRLLSPDTAFVSRARLPHLPRADWIRVPPDLAVEVRSVSDLLSATLAKGHLWIASGTPVVWVVDPDAQAIFVLRSGHSPVIARSGQEVDAEPVLSGFRMPVAFAFADLPGGASLSGATGAEPPES
jgi:Uma2 family endonuclease